MHGFLCINKSQGATSRDAVNAIQRLVRPSKVGHAGTLDPLATGVLVIAVGHATRLIRFVQQMPKTYIGTFELGKTSDTEDITGEVVSHDIDPPPTIDAIQQAISPLLGNIMQRPPAYSALKVDGKRAYSLAREGKQVKLEPRPIVVHEIELIRYEFPILELRIVCGSGTYVRSLGRDLGESLGCGAVMTGLIRTAIGSFALGDASRTEDFTSADQIAAMVTPLGTGVSELTRVVVDADQIQSLSFGQKLQLSLEEEQVAAFDANGILIAVLARSEDGYRPAVNFAGRA